VFAERLNIITRCVAPGPGKESDAVGQSKSTGGRMPTTTIKCVRSNGKPAKGVRVTIGFDFSDHPLSSGFTGSEYTDSDGLAKIDHSNTGKAYVYLNGDKQDRPINVPGSFSFTL
jgi:hypothetical protein